LYLQSNRDEVIKQRGNHILAYRDEKGKRLQTYDYAKQNVGVFKTFLEQSMAFTDNRIPSTQIIISAKSDLDDLITEIINSLFGLNELFQNQHGCKLFKASSKTLNDLRQKGDDENWFVLQLSRLATLIDDIYFGDIKKQVTNVPSGSINMLETLFSAKRIGYDKDAFDGLRKIHSLRSVKFPIHGGESKAIDIFKGLGISYPVRDWSSACNVCLKEFLSCIHKPIVSLK
jgi:hypothetical protein